MKGYWNGEPATFVGVKYEVTEPTVKTWWQGMFVGKIRQGIEITYRGKTWIIDNEHGDGFYKVTRGMGSPRCSHKSIENPKRLHEIHDDEINKIINRDMLDVEHESHQCWLRENFPEDYKRSQALLKHIKNLNNERFKTN